MEDLQLDLVSFQDLDLSKYFNLVIGNGFSTGINRSFAYKSLYEAGVKLGVIREAEKSLFHAFNTHDFEYLLRKLYQASVVNKILGIDHLTPSQKYQLIKGALIRAVNQVHPEFSELDVSWMQECAELMRKMRNVFSLNYDLFPYWIASVDDFKGFTDFFWSDTLVFDLFNLDTWYDRTRLYYPHGALFLFEDVQGEISKLHRRDNASVLDQIGSNLDDFNIPVFISEGTHGEKLRRIQSNQYLTFAYRRLTEIFGGLIIYGTSLSLQDNHIINAIRGANLFSIAFGIYPEGKSAFDVQAIKATIEQKFQGTSIKKFEYFDTRTCPLSYAISQTA